jgi:hypothetical protein
MINRIVEEEERKLRFEITEKNEILIDTEKILNENGKSLRDNFEIIFQSFSSNIAKNLADDWNADFEDLSEKYKNQCSTSAQLKEKLKRLANAENQR